MKNLNKILLASTIAVISTAGHAELKSLDDIEMSGLTGQAGLTIELETQIDIGEVVYTDEGQLAMINTHIGGQSGSLVDDVEITIDIQADGDAVVDVHSISGTPIDIGITQDAIELRGTGGETTTLVSNLNIDGYINRVTMTVDTATDTLNFMSEVSVDDLNMDIDFLATGIRNMSVHGAGYQEGVTTLADADYFVHSEAAIKAGNSTATRAGGETSALQINLAPVAMDINIGAMELGGTSIGSVKFDDLTISNTQLLVYGH